MGAVGSKLVTHSHCLFQDGWSQVAPIQVWGICPSDVKSYLLIIINNKLHLYIETISPLKVAISSFKLTKMSQCQLLKSKDTAIEKHL